MFVVQAESLDHGERVAETAFVARLDREHVEHAEPGLWLRGVCLGQEHGDMRTGADEFAFEGQSLRRLGRSSNGGKRSGREDGRSDREKYTHAQKCKAAGPSRHAGRVCGMRIHERRENAFVKLVGTGIPVSALYMNAFAL